MAVRSPRILSICTGAGGLDLGVKLACPAARTVCYVEREAFAVAELVAAMEAACLDEAPVWSDLGSFDGTAWRGRVDWLIGGIPCQPHSTASNQRRGADDERDLWPAAARVIREVQPAVVFLETWMASFGTISTRLGQSYRDWATGLRRDYSRRLRSAPRIRDSGSSLWATATADASTSDRGEWTGRYYRREDGTKVTTALSHQVGQWPTALATDGDKASKQHGSGTLSLPMMARLWPTITVSDGAETGYHGNGDLKLSRATRMWGTPLARDHKDGSTENIPATSFLSRQVQHSPLARMTSKDGHTCSPRCRRLNPLFVERLMGWPGGWTLLPTGLRDYESSVTEWSRWWRLMRSALSRLG